MLGSLSAARGIGGGEVRAA